jgi:hypothetical protein
MFMRRINVPVGVTHRYQVYTPSGTNSWRIIRLESGQKNKTIKNERINGIVSQFKMGALSFDETKAQLQLIAEELYKADGVRVSRYESNKENEKLMDRYLAEVIEPKDSKPRSKKAAREYLYRAIRAIGELSAMSAPQHKLVAAINKAYPDQRQRRIVASFNAFLGWAGRKSKAVP